jgi:formylmethanofuran dehydrogenase subunit E
MEVRSMSDYETLLEKAKKFHGDLCPGIVLGTRMTIAGLRELGMDPLEKNRNLIVYVEIDRCAADAIQAITGCSLGHRTLKHVNYGKFAATFVNAENGDAVRVAVAERSGPAGSDRKNIVKNLAAVSESDLLRIRKVTVAIPDEDLPGFPRSRVNCSICGEQVLDSKEVVADGKPVCRSCASGAYYKMADTEALKK